jgi:hypothetical protein
MMSGKARPSFFEKKEAKKLLFVGPVLVSPNGPSCPASLRAQRSNDGRMVGRGGPAPTGPMSKSFFASFFSKKEVLPSFLGFSQ